ncbi:efflux RND transporter permease subunit [Paenibacillus xerothermodurans]|uniref:AcrB/AcrD/AcrF family protein n=1 Tax=Paenibacillus xerothermodurans TaxID=1977292 RepID=A0A2W1NAS0_PAEXE|nr:efflux RND transporter permease subunit [Paenibacillus xerothermodurans]PZE21507.1 AcrB/AcrD/AcrF family protein [Paenibacillus xerothermodurans]
MNQLTRFSLKNVAAILIISVILFIAGSFSATTLKQESMPDISLPVVFVSTVYPAPPMDVMEDVTQELEKRIVGIEGLKKIDSTSNENFSMITVELINGRSPDDAKDDIEDALADVELPAGASKPKVSKFGSNEFPVYFAAMQGDENTNQEELNRIYTDVIEPTLSAMDGIDHVDSVGQQEATLSLKLDLNALNTYGLTPDSVTQSIRSAVMSSPAGSADLNGTTQSIRVESDLNTIYNLENMKIASPTGQTVLLKEIAKVEAVSESEYLTRFNNLPAIGLTLFKSKDANTVEFADQVESLMAGWEKDYPNINFTSVFNSATDVKKSISGMLKEGTLGAILASVMILLFLRNVRMTLIVLVSIPLSILTTLCMMAWLDLSLNIMTLGGLTIAVGRVVDDSIVVIENIYTELQKAHERNESVIALATSKVASAITSSTITTAGVFIPIAFVSGILGDIFRPFAITLVVALMASLIVALTVIPMLAKLMVLKSNKIKHHDEASQGKLTQQYKKILNYSLSNPIKIIMLSVLILVVSIGGTVPFLASSFMPESATEKQVQFTLKLPRETSFEAMDMKVREIEAMFGEAKDASGQPVFEYYESMVGYDQMNTSGERTDYRAMIMASVSDHLDAEETAEEFKQKIKYIVPQESEVEGVLLSAAMSGTGEDFAFLLKGEDLNQLTAGVQSIRKKLEEFPELEEIKDNLSERKLQITVGVDQNKARLYGLSAAQVTGAVSQWMNETEIGEIKFDNVSFLTKVTVDEQFKDSIEEIGRIRIPTPSGTTVNLNEVAKVRQLDAPAAISREMQQQYVKITAKIDSTDKGGVSARVTEALQSVELPPGVRTQVQGVSEDIQESFGQMAVAMLAAIMIVYLVMVIAFGNASAPFAIMFSLPLAAIGGFLGLFLTGESINITSLIGFLMLVGIVVTNAIVLVDRVQQLREDGMNVHDALVEAGLTRLRPIIMTAGATIFSQLPLALGLSEGTLISKSLAVVVIGGLTTSTILTLVVVPVIYQLIDRTNNRISRIFNRKGAALSDSKSAPAPQ